MNGVVKSKLVDPVYIQIHTCEWCLHTYGFRGATFPFSFTQQTLIENAHQSEGMEHGTMGYIYTPLLATIATNFTTAASALSTYAHRIYC
jgi:hypothetical protein